MSIFNFQRSPQQKPAYPLSYAEVKRQYGPLAGLIGTWVGSSGWKVVSQRRASASFGYTVASYSFREQLTVAPGFADRAASLVQGARGLRFERRVYFTEDVPGVGLKGQLALVERGTWLYMPDGSISLRRADAEGTIARGFAGQSEAAFQVPAMSPYPRGGAEGPAGFYDAFAMTDHPAYTRNPGWALEAALDGQQLRRSTTVQVQAHGANGQARQHHLLWLHETEATDGPGSMLLQYAQVTEHRMDDLARQYGPAIYPEIAVNTLTKLNS